MTDPLASALRSKILCLLLLHWKPQAIAEKVHCHRNTVYTMQENLFMYHSFFRPQFHSRKALQKIRSNNHELCRKKWSDSCEKSEVTCASVHDIQNSEEKTLKWKTRSAWRNSIRLSLKINDVSLMCLLRCYEIINDMSLEIARTIDIDNSVYNDLSSDVSLDFASSVCFDFDDSICFEFVRRCLRSWWDSRWNERMLQR